MFKTIVVPADSASSIEQLGTKEKFWYENALLGPCLCKIARDETGEDWSEKLSAELASLLGLPHANYELATWNERACVVSPNFVPNNGSLILGNELLVQIDQSYAENLTRFRKKEHTVEAVSTALQSTNCQLPLGWMAPEGVIDAIGLFSGYLLLDALVGNTDRHHENWGLVQVNAAGKTFSHLAPTFDHASCLGCHETDAVRARRLSTPDPNYTVKFYARKAKSALYRTAEDSKPLTTLDAFIECARMTPGAQYWLSRVESLSTSDLSQLVGEVPEHRMSPICRAFVQELLVANRMALGEAANTL